MQHPRNILLGAQARTGVLPVSDHHSCAPARMRRSLPLQSELIEEFGAFVFDVTLDSEDGDRASCRYFWQVLERAHQTGKAVPAGLQHYFV